MCQPFGNHLGWSEHGRSGYPQFPIDFQMLCRPGIRKSEVYEELYGREVVFIRWLWQGSGLGWHDEFMSFFGQFLGFISQKWTIIFIPCHGWSIFPIYFRNKPMTIFWVRPEMGIPIYGHFSGNDNQLPDLDGTLLGVWFQLQVEKTTMSYRRSTATYRRLSGLHSKDCFFGKSRF